MSTRRYLLMLVATAALAGCTSGTGGSAAPPATASDPPSVWREFVACARSHGQANMPDAIVDDTGRATFPDVAGFESKSALEAVRQDCGAILEKLPPNANPLGRPVMTPERLEAERRYAQCIRDQGLTDFPDPDSNGETNLPPRYNTTPIDPEMVRIWDEKVRPNCYPILTPFLVPSASATP